MAEAEPNLAKRYRTLLERLYAFQACHKVKAGPFQQYDRFDLLITYLRGHTETNDLLEPCRLIQQLRLMGVTIGTSLHNVCNSWYGGVPGADYNECPFADCTKCKNHLNANECAPDMGWLFETEARLVHQLIKQIKLEPIRQAGPKAITRVLKGLPMDEHEVSLVQYDVDGFVDRVSQWKQPVTLRRKTTPLLHVQPLQSHH